MYKETISDRTLLPITGGLHGLGLCAINMVCEWMNVEIRRDGYLWQQSYSTGIPRHPVKQTRPLNDGESTGTSITFKPDDKIFVERPLFDYERLARRCREIAYQIAGLTVKIRDERETPHRENTYYSEQGLISLIDELREGSETPFHDVIHHQTILEIPEQPETKQQAYALWIEFAFQFSDRPEDTEVGFVNSVQMADGGAHVDAVRRGIVLGLNKHLVEHQIMIPQDAFGIISAVSVRLAEPKFESPTKVKLMNHEIIREIEHVVIEAIDTFAAAHPDQMQRIIDHCLANRSRRAAR